MQHWGILLHGICHIQQMRQRLIVHLDQFKRILSGSFSAGGYGSHGMAVIQHLGIRQNVAGQIQ